MRSARPDHTRIIGGPLDASRTRRGQGGCGVVPLRLSPLVQGVQQRDRMLGCDADGSGYHRH
jgi:hypothetical protein